MGIIVRPILALSLYVPLLWCGSVRGQRVPHNQDRPPGPPLSPQEALRSFQLPEGFRVELVASEPDIVNPVKMCFDGRGRIWLVESLEYPRQRAGKGRDRVRILEDADRDGVVDTFKVFADGLNIPCGIALGHGGVFVTNSPDILFLEDADGDDRADNRRVVLTGFGRHDTHELPNTLTWGPDGWLYGLNGVFNPAHIRHKGKEYRFTCALWRLHPRTQDFEVFAEGTSNPWGLGFDRLGSAFVEACVIDHLFHLTETGYYHRQAGKYPPFTWKIGSIVKHKNYKAAYCGLEIYDADAYPEGYRRLAYFGNIHGSCINADRLARNGSTYLASRGPIILKTQDRWFMPVDIKLGPDGCLYVLDWYDRYHCYQDARRDPEGIDRLKGRLWRVVYGDRKAPKEFDLVTEDTDALVSHLFAANRWWRDSARGILVDRRDPGAHRRLKRIVLDASSPSYSRMQAFWTLLGCEDPGTRPWVLDCDFHLQVLSLADSALRAWGVRAAGDVRQVDETVARRVAEMARDPHPDVRLQVAIASRKLFGDSALSVLLEVLAHSASDPLIPRIVWRNLEPLLEKQGPALVRWLEQRDFTRYPSVELLLGRIVERVLAGSAQDSAALVSLVGLLLRHPDAHRVAAGRCLEALGSSLLTGEMETAILELLRPRLTELVASMARGNPRDPLYMPSMTLAAGWKEPAALAACRGILRSPDADDELRAAALRALVVAEDPAVLEFAAASLRGAGGETPEALLVEVLAALGKLRADEVAEIVLGEFQRLPPALRPRAIDLLCQRSSWASALLDAVASGDIDRRQLNITQVRRLLALRNQGISRRVAESWGTLREERDPRREEVIARMKKVLASGDRNAERGKLVFQKICAQCHVLYGQGNEVGPDLTASGRDTLELLLSNLLDPNLVIGRDYRAHNALTRDGRALTGLLVEDSPQRVVLRVAGGEEEVIPRKEILELSASRVSLMPEDLETTMSEEEFRDLIAYLGYDKIDE